MQQILAPKSPGLPFLWEESNSTFYQLNSHLLHWISPALRKKKKKKKRGETTHCLRCITELELYISADHFHQCGRAVTCAFHHSGIFGAHSSAPWNSGVFTALFEIVGLVENMAIQFRVPSNTQTESCGEIKEDVTTSQQTWRADDYEWGSKVNQLVMNALVSAQSTKGLKDQ